MELEVWDTLLQHMKVKLFSRVRRLATPWTAACQAPLSMGFSRQGYWSGLPLPSPLFQMRRLKVNRKVSLLLRAFLIAQLVKNPPAMQEALVRFLGREDPVEKG